VPATRLARRLDKFGLETVWQEFSPLAAATGAVNLGQGFPDWASPDFVKAAMKRAQDENQNQYCRSAGLPVLCKELAKRCAAARGARARASSPGVADRPSNLSPLPPARAATLAFFRGPSTGRRR
jgi:DNA-binding transcriptional MocR family regulator